jgi:hypothetical protein
MITFTTPALNRLLPWPLTTYLNRFGFSRSWLSLRIISEEWWLNSLLPLIHLEFLLVFQELFGMLALLFVGHIGI